ncbi:serine hydrolase domain-containing protein [Gaetbulibacter sp. M235]|uniref:serine hydrolase domain-containing protein n=1 Tax=Gaetbulibacter sp. M235 TaxID=3126510 RepID=UPI00374E2161
MKKIIAFIMLTLSSVGFSQTTDNPQHTKPKNAKKLAKEFLKANHIPGMSISVSKHGKLIWSKGFGHANLKPKVRVKPKKTIFRIASISKSITGVALAKLMDDNLIDINKSIYDYLPNYPKKAYDFNVRQLGGNLAGIRHYKDIDEYALNIKMTISEGLSLFKDDDLLFEPGTQYHYSSMGYALLSEIMETASGIPFSKFVNDSIFIPLEMTHSSTDNSDIKVTNKTEFYKSTSLKKPVIAKPVSNEYKVASGGFLSTSEDIVKFGNEIIFPKIISKEALSEIITSQRLKSGNKTGYGIGFSVGHSQKGTPKYYHTGGGVGASTILLIYPEEELVITVLTNLTGVNMVEFGNQLESFFID